MGTFDASADLRGAEFVGLDMSETTFREVNLISARMHGVLLMNADIDGAIDGLRLNGVEVLPLIEAELDRLHPERTRLRPTTPEGMRKALATVESFWAPTMARADALPPGGVERSVNGEWSFAETLRHLVFVTDAWFGHAVLGETRPFHPLGVPASFITNGPEFGIDTAARPSFSDVIAARADRLASLGEFLGGVSQEELDRPREPNDAPGWPPPEARTAMSCLQVILNEEWAHHQFAVRDLAVIEAG
jgi:hypothetical protein